MATPTLLQRNAPRSHARHRARKWIKRIVLALGCLAGITGIVYAWLPSPILVDVATARRVSLDVEVAEDGKTRVRDRFVVTAPVTGSLARVELEAGAMVARGDVIARLAPPDPALLDAHTRDEATARLAAAIARHRRADTAIARATIARDVAVREAARARTLAESRAISGVERERLELEEQLAIRDVTAAETERTAAAAEVAAIRALLGQHATRPGTPIDVVAPGSGRILRVVRDSAGPIAAGAPLVELGDPRDIEVEIDVLSSDATRIAPGMETALEGWGGEPMRGHVRLVEPSAFTRISALGVEEQRVKVIVAIDRPPPALGDSFRVDARIVLWRGVVVAVPASAVFRDHDRWVVYVVEDGRARLQPVTLGHRGRLAVEITNGIVEGTTIVVHPSDRVGDGARVRPR